MGVPVGFDGASVSSECLKSSTALCADESRIAMAHLEALRGCSGTLGDRPVSGLPIDKVSLTPQHLIVEYVSTESIFGMVSPSYKIKGVKLVGTGHIQVMRYVYTIAQVEDVYFEGKKLREMPGFRELLTEWIKPGEQIVSVPNGKISIVHAYTGKKNILNATALEHYKMTVPLAFLDIIGKDPAPNKILYGNPAVPFIQQGDDNPMAAAYYNSQSGRFEILRQFDKLTLLQNFQRRFSQAMSATG
jgi:hypothetical protein